MSMKNPAIKAGLMMLEVWAASFLIASLALLECTSTELFFAEEAVGCTSCGQEIR